MSYVVVIIERMADTQVIGPFTTRQAARKERDAQEDARPRCSAVVAPLARPSTR